MAELAIVSFKVEQTEVQVKLHTVHLEYGYTLTPSADECRSGAVFDLSVEILGHDVLRDRVLVSGVDEHRIECAAGSTRGPIAATRELIVGQQLLNEDIGEDEIKLRVVAKPEKGEPVSAETPVVRGNF